MGPAVGSGVGPGWGSVSPETGVWPLEEGDWAPPGGVVGGSRTGSQVHLARTQCQVQGANQVMGTSKEAQLKTTTKVHLPRVSHKEPTGSAGLEQVSDLKV